MARFNFFAELLIISLIVLEIDGRKKKQKNENMDFTGVYNCMMGHLHCGKAALYEGCWNNLEKKTQYWLLDTVNECQPNKFEYDTTYNNIVETLIRLSDDVWWPCFDKTCNLLCEYSKETSNAGKNDEKKKNESDKMEDGRNCIAMNMGACSFDSCVAEREKIS